MKTSKRLNILSGLSFLFLILSLAIASMIGSIGELSTLTIFMIFLLLIIYVITKQFIMLTVREWRHLNIVEHFKFYLIGSIYPIKGLYIDREPTRLVLYDDNKNVHNILLDSINKVKVVLKKETETLSKEEFLKRYYK